ncbi:uncharacterized protein LOC130646290 [Hydractinia symbiolongicarpus]|uniref:uncharacterized protein LOC130646290 n=1 Tax=Hydractinia symbiolongicarpus TaxID=13093 RepID=UPI0025506002|nr:uncharacterized protein LOC130646290 [Hydractinia symbiolongicarpus]
MSYFLLISFCALVAAIHQGEGLECYNYPPINKQRTTTCGNLQSCGNIKQMMYFNGTIYKKDITGCFPTMYCTGICENLRRIAQRLPRYTLLQCRVSCCHDNLCNVPT